jgi:serine/threonine protein kinase HipA of HipAB toxin-antitoxin module
MDARSISMKPARRVAAAVEAAEAPAAVVAEAPAAAAGVVEAAVAAVVDPVRGESPAGKRRKGRPAG